VRQLVRGEEAAALFQDRRKIQAGGQCAAGAALEVLAVQLKRSRGGLGGVRVGVCGGPSGGCDVAAPVRVGRRRYSGEARVRASTWSDGRACGETTRSCSRPARVKPMHHQSQRAQHRTGSCEVHGGELAALVAELLLLEQQQHAVADHALVQPLHHARRCTSAGGGLEPWDRRRVCGGGGGSRELRLLGYRLYACWHRGVRTSRSSVCCLWMV
jgi:hypothetical protein